MNSSAADLFETRMPIRIRIRLLMSVALAALIALTACTPRPAPADSKASETGTAALKITLPAVKTVNTDVKTDVVSAAEIPASPPPLPYNPSRQILLDSGAVYFQACAICHGKNGRGGRGPAVTNSDYVMADRERLIRTVLAGVKEPIHVNGVRWKTGEMLGWAETWDDFKIAAVLTYVRALNDTLVTDCVPEDYEAGTWASCTSTPRDPAEMARDSIAVDEVAAMRRALGLR